MNPRSSLSALMAALAGLVLAPTALGDVTYTLQFNPATSAETQQVANSVAAAAALYNQHGSFNKHWNVYYNAGIPTAEANYSGYMGYGGQRTVRVAMHEAGHTFGMGTGPNYANLIAGGVWKGQHGNQAQFDTYNTYADGLHGDGHAIWPGGFNYENEDGTLERIWHIRIMAGIRCDMGILAFNKEAENELVHPGQTAEFHVKSPTATSYQWQRNGVALTNGGDISGANSPTLRIANAEAADAGTYRCVATGAGETLNSRGRQLRVDPRERLGQWNLDGNVADSAKANHGTAFGSPAYVAGKIGQAIDLDGIDDYVQLPAGAALAKDFTVATWVHWDGGGNWQRIFDFGTGTHQHVFLCPKSGGNTLRLVFKDSYNGRNVEHQVNSTVLPTGQWVHLAAVLNGDCATLYVNGKPVGTTFGIPVDPIDFLPTQNYIGKSQYNDPLFNGRVDDFRVYNHALDGSEIWALWGQSANQPPVFQQEIVSMPNAATGQAYAGQSLAGHASDPDSGTLVFTKLNGPAWLSIAPNGTLSGTPGAANAGVNRFIVKVEDASGASSDAEVRIHVLGTFAYWNFEGGTANTHVPYTKTTAGQYDGSIADQSGAGNHLSAWSTTWHWYRPQVPGSTTPQTGAANTLSIQNANSVPALSTIGTALTTWSPRKWTIEAAVRPDDATNGFQTFIGRDSRGAHGGDPALAALYFTIVPNGGLRINFTDAAGNNWGITSAANTMQDGKWHAVAATSDGTSLSLHVKNLTNGDPGYTLLGSVNLSASIDPALSTGAGDGGDWDAGVFSIARGLYNGGHTDRFFGHLDDIRLTEGALAPAAFLYTTPPPPAPTFATWISTYPGAGGTTGFEEDPDRDGLANGIEHFFGTDPSTPNIGLTALTRDDTALTFQHPRNPDPASDVSATYRWSHDLATWHDGGTTAEGTTVSFSPAPDTPSAGTTTVTAHLTGAIPPMIYLRLEASQNPVGQ